MVLLVACALLTVLILYAAQSAQCEVVFAILQCTPASQTVGVAVVAVVAVAAVIAHIIRRPIAGAADEIAEVIQPVQM